MFYVLVIKDSDGVVNKLLFDSIKHAKFYYRYVLKRNPNATSIELRKLKDDTLVAIWL